MSTGPVRTALAIRHVPFEDLGIFGDVLAERGYRIRYSDAGLDAVDRRAWRDADLLVVLGGPIGVGDIDRYPYIADEIDALTGRLADQRPTLGVCLGAQLMAAALGAEVGPTGAVEIGYGPLTLTESGARSVLNRLGQTPVLHWHGDQFAIPLGADRLASTPGFDHQAFALGDHALALQFHLEADPERIESWLIGHAHELATQRIDPRVIRADARRFGPELAARGRAVLAEWLARAGG
ncbi:glutamine amidotransferase [Gordonia sp. VNK21]|uniref:glutamine amidotransferase n=1 Tax=Gordonia sp. VNK21 TaxID=3382483 RepID=UPI0038D38D9D